MSAHASTEGGHLGSSLKRGVTFTEFLQGDIAYLFRKQYSRTLSEVDDLIKRQLFIRSKLGDQKADQIEKEPDSFYNHERFRIWQAQARFRALITSLIVFPAVTTVMNGNRNGLGLIRSKPVFGLPLFAVIYASSFWMWHRYVGYSAESYYEQNYAKNHKMLRNLMIR